jgi:uncharacterized membrane protein
MVFETEAVGGEGHHRLARLDQRGPARGSQKGFDGGANGRCGEFGFRRIFAHVTLCADRGANLSARYCLTTSLIPRTSRIEALSDGVFAIAMTLLVLKLEVPEVMHHSSNADMLQQLLDPGPAFATYVITFLVAGGFWYLHHLTFHFIRHVDGGLVWINLVFLMLVSLLPFSAGLMSHLLIHPVTQLFYYGNQLAIALVLNLHWDYTRGKGFVDVGHLERWDAAHL